jgi:hypothetical protein
MLHAKCLRAIGQYLETLPIQAFEIEKKGKEYVVRTASLSPTAQWLFKESPNEVSDSPTLATKKASSNDRSMHYETLDISRLDAQGRKKRRKHAFSQTRRAKTLSQLLRTVGEHLDRLDVSAFTVSWFPDSVSVDYQRAELDRERKDFTLERLRELGLHMQLHRTGREA